MAPSPEMSPATRTVIVAYRFDLEWSYTHITDRLAVHHEAVKSLCQRVKNRCDDAEQAQNANRLDLYLLYIQNEEGLGRKPVA